MTTLTQKSQVTIPKQFRIALGLGPGDEVQFEFTRDKSGVVLQKKPRKLPFEKWRGCLGTLDTDVIIDDLRGGVRTGAGRDANRS